MTGVSFDWEENIPQHELYPDNQRYLIEKKSLGFIAQEIEKVIPEVVWIDKFGYRQLQYDVLVSIGVGAIKENQQRIVDLNNKLQNLKVTLNG